jgi:TPR repeat protein
MEVLITMQRFNFLIFGIILIASTNSCKATEPQNKKFVYDPESSFSFYLSDSDLDSAKKKAIQGDAEAAIKVAVYYETVKLDTMSGLAWMNISANHGNVIAQLNMAKLYLYDGRLKNVKLAIFWLKEAKQNGSTEAKKILEEIEKTEGKQLK